MEEPYKNNGGSFARSMHERFNNPTTRRLMIAHQRLQIEGKYRDLAKALQLSPDVADRFLDLLAEQEVNGWDRGQWGQAQPT
jgi:hypothetical protein